MKNRGSAALIPPTFSSFLPYWMASREYLEPNGREIEKRSSTSKVTSPETKMSGLRACTEKSNTNEATVEVVVLYPTMRVNANTEATPNIAIWNKTEPLIPCMERELRSGKSSVCRDLGRTPESV
jgi:hypothetical protein